MTRAADADQACPACGRITLTMRGGGEVCPACGWQDDPESRADPALTSSLNGLSLTQARENVKRFDLAFPPSEAGV
jgi:hypothetical protein